MKPIYEEVDGWSEDITNAKKLEDLPEKCQAYIKKIKEYLNVSIGIVSVGPRRDQTIIVEAVK